MRADDLSENACIFLDAEKHNCTVREARPDICRIYPGQPQCPYYDLLQFERNIQEDENVLVEVTFWHDG